MKSSLFIGQIPIIFIIWAPSSPCTYRAPPPPGPRHRAWRRLQSDGLGELGDLMVI